MAKRKKNKILTIAELKSYVRGAVDLNPEGWCPDKNQWEQIAELIENVIEGASVAARSTYEYEEKRDSVKPAVPSSMMTTDSEDPQHTGGRFDASMNPETRPQIEKVGTAGVKDETTGAISSGIMVKTPNVDTSEGEYESGFK